MSPRVLIIDDEVEIRRNLTFGLTQEGFTCTSCPDGISAIHELYRSRDAGEGYDYLISDIFMPDIDGLKILKVIKSEFPELPVQIITGFGNEILEATALAEENTGFLDKPFEISDLVEALGKLKAGATTSDSGAAAGDSGESREVMSSYLSIRIDNPAQDMSAYKELYMMPGVVSCDAVNGDVDIIMLIQAGNEGEMAALQEKITAVEGVEVVSSSSVERPKLDKDVGDFLNIYQKAVKASDQANLPKLSSPKSYVIVDIDKNSIQQIFTTLFFMDEVVFCDVIDDGSRLIGIITKSGAFGKTPRIVEKLNQIDGVLRVKEASIIKLMEY